MPQSCLQAEMLRYAAYREKQFNALFDFWDVNCSGRVAMSQIHEVLLRQKEFTGNENIEVEGNTSECLYFM